MSLFKHYLLIVAISFLPLVSIFLTPDLPHTHDGLVHLARMAAYDKALRGGQILPRWVSDLNYGYGMPLFNFIYHTPYLLSALFISVGFSLVNSFKIVLLLSFLLSGITMFAFAHELFDDSQKALVVTLFYQFAPFRLVEVLVRGSFGEMYTYAFLPLVLFGLTKISKKPTISYIVITAIATALLIISHNSISLVFFGISSLFILFFFKKERIPYGVIALALGLSLASFYWLPAMLEHGYTLGDLYMRDRFKEHFPPIVNFFIPNFFNAKNIQTGGISVQFGLFHMIALLTSIHIFMSNKKTDSIIKKSLLFSLVLIIISLFFMQPISKIFWENIPMLRQFQFPWRFLSVTSLATALLSVSFFSYPIFNKNNWVFLIIILGMIFSTAYYWYPPLGFDKIKDEKQFWNYPLTTTYFGETDVVWSAGPAKEYAKQQIEIIDGQANFSSIIKQSTIHTTVVESKNGARLVDNTQYFPGWKVYVNNTKVPVEFQDQNWRGLVTFAIPKGQSNIRVIFKKSIIQRIGEYISLGTILLLTCMTVMHIRKKNS